MNWARLAFEIGSELLHEWRRKRAAAKAARAWAERTSPMRACPYCREIAYTPGQTACFKCGRLL